MSEFNNTEKIAVTGATGHLGKLVVGSLLNRGASPSSITAIVRNTKKAAGLADRGIEIREADYSKPETLGSALEGIDKLLLVSSSEVGQRAAQHKNVIDAAKNVGVKLIVYTSVLNADTAQIKLAGEHKATEELIRSSGIPYIFLRNGWYLENYDAAIDQAGKTGALYGSAGDGRISAASRADYAEAAAAVLIGPVEANSVFELGGDASFTMKELAEKISDATATDVEYKDLPVADYAALLVSAGLPEPYAEILADSDLGISRGELYTDSKHLSALIGRPAATIEEVRRNGHLNHHAAA